MRVALNAMQVRAAKSGVGQYVEGLLAGWTQQPVEGTEFDDQPLELTVYCSPENLLNYRPYTNPTVQCRVWGQSESRKIFRLACEHLFLASEIKKQDFHLFHGPSNFLPLSLRTPSVVSLHDFSYYVHPQRCPWLRRQYWYAMTRSTVAQATRIILSSHNTALDLEKYFPHAAAKAVVVPLGVHDRFRPIAETDTESLKSWLDQWLRKNGLKGHPKSEPPPPVILSVCTLEPGKNLQTLVRAFECVASHPSQPCLVLVGDRGWKFQTLLDQIDQSPLKQRVLVTGHVPDEDVVRLMQSCHVFAYPSLYEGFGLPPLEALACGATVLSSHAGSLGEVLQGLIPATNLLPPQDEKLWTQKLNETLDQSPADSAARQQRSQAVKARFSWEKTAEETYKVYRSALEAW